MKKILWYSVLIVFVIFNITTGCKTTSSPSGPATATHIPTFPYSDMVTVPAGTYTQTDTSSNSFSHSISAFKIGKYEVTYYLWYTVYVWAGTNGYTFQNAGKEGNNGTAGALTTTAKYEPVAYINWRDAIVWCNAYSEKSGLTPLYYSDASYTTIIKDSTSGAYNLSINSTPGSFDYPYVNWSATGYRLPTEGEWQYAAGYIDASNWKAPNFASGATADYTDATATGLVAWYNANASSTTHDAGGKNPNALGIRDMSGNVIEWCWDWYGNYPGTSTDYQGPASGTKRLNRGGSYFSSDIGMQVGYRLLGSNPYFTSGNYGFRIAKAN